MSTALNLTPEPGHFWTPEMLAERMDAPLKWVRERMATGELPNVRTGRRRYWTTDCAVRYAAQIEAKATAPTSVSGFDRRTRSGRARA